MLRALPRDLVGAKHKAFGSLKAPPVDRSRWLRYTLYASTLIISVIRPVRRYKLFLGSRIKQRRTELGLHQKYIAELMDVNASTIQRYEAGTIDNTKKLILEGLAEALHVSVEWLKGKTSYKPECTLYYLLLSDFSDE